MTCKNFGWHKSWQTLPNGRRRHISGLEFEYDEDLGWSTCDDTLEEFHAYEVAQGMPLHDIQSRLLRLVRECAEWRDE
jgi:hypothetical protein